VTVTAKVAVTESYLRKRQFDKEPLPFLGKGEIRKGPVSQMAVALDKNFINRFFWLATLIV